MEGKILIVDDDIDTLQLVGTMLERQGFQILAANNGEKAVRLAQEEIPNLIILDVMMPGMDGYEVTRRLRATESTAYIPIILFTAKAQVDDKVVGFESGADDYLTKPTHPAELIARVKTILSRPKTGALQPMGDMVQDIVVNNAVFGLISARGGLGVSTLALNIAVSIHQQTDDYVTLAEFQPGQATIGLQLGYKESQALNNLLKKPASELHAQTIEEELITHGSGIQILLASYNPTDAPMKQAIEQFAAITANLSQMAPYTILDLGNGLHDLNRKLIKMCTQVIIPVEPATITLIQTKVLLQELQDLGLRHDQIHVVINNRIRLEVTIPANRVQDELDHPVAGIITPAPEQAYQAIARRLPMILHQPSSIYATQVNKLTSNLLPKKDAK